MFSTTYNKDGVIIIDKKEIMMSYIKGWFVFDVLACIPFDKFLNFILNSSSSN